MSAGVKDVWRLLALILMVRVRPIGGLGSIHRMRAISLLSLTGTFGGISPSLWNLYCLLMSNF